MTQLSALKYLTEMPAFKKIWAGCEMAYALACMMVLPASLMLPGLWLAQQASVTEISATAYSFTPEPTSPGQSLVLDSRVVIDTTTRKAVYRTWLEDEHHQVVYRYPNKLVEDTPRLSFGNRVLEVPASIRPGVYTVVIEVEYSLNPIKTARTRVEVAQIDVR